MRTEERRIPESEFAADLEEGLAELSAAINTAIQEHGLTIASIARGTRCNWETVSHAANNIPVRFDSGRRILYYLKSISQ